MQKDPKHSNGPRPLRFYGPRPSLDGLRAGIDMAEAGYV